MPAADATPPRPALPSAWAPVPVFRPLPPVATAAPDAATGLAALQARLAHDMRCLGLPAKDWMPPPDHWQSAPDEPETAVLDVAIIGAGQAGLAAGLALRLLGIHPVLFDRAPAGQEGPWATTARMETLRSPKDLTGPALGLPALTFRAWFEAQFGATAWAGLDKIPRSMWMDYLRWFRSVSGLDVRNGVELLATTPRADVTVDLLLRDAAGTRRVRARRVVLATGRDGLGGPAVPAFLQGLPRGLPDANGGGGLWAHSSDAGDFTALAGRRVVVIGAGSSAMDVAGSALEAGACSVDLLIRRPDLPRINKSKGAGAPGLVLGFPDLPDADRWALRHYINTTQVPPPHGSTLRVSRHANAHFHFGCPVLALRRQGRRLQIDTPRGRFDADFVLAATGFVVDWAQRPELAAIAPHIRTWAERHVPAPGSEDAELDTSPDLGPLFEFQPRTPGACPGLARIHCFNHPATLSHGTVSGDIPAISDGARRLAQGLAAAFYREDLDHHMARLRAYDDPELLGDEWRPADTAAVLAQRAAEDATLDTFHSAAATAAQHTS
jgi:cation diffusion facilitator CzcD-associated flavoprotein CzcO